MAEQLNFPGVVEQVYEHPGIALIHDTAGNRERIFGLNAVGQILISLMQFRGPCASFNEYGYGLTPSSFRAPNLRSRSARKCCRRLRFPILPAVCCHSHISSIFALTRGLLLSCRAAWLLVPVLGENDYISECQPTKGGSLHRFAALFVDKIDTVCIDLLSLTAR